MKSIVEFIEQRSMLSHGGNINEKQAFLIKGHTTDQTDYVDLDLPSGTKWAKCNIGATKPEEPGLYFQWGQMKGYKYGNKRGFITQDKYSTTSEKLYKKNSTLEDKDDASYQVTNGRFRMPTKDELVELIDNTKSFWTDINGMNGRKFVSKKDESKWIFIPAGGYFTFEGGASFVYYNSFGNLWSSTCYNDKQACALYFMSEICDCDSDKYSSALPIRPVLNK